MNPASSLHHRHPYVLSLARSLSLSTKALPCNRGKMFTNMVSELGFLGRLRFKFRHLLLPYVNPEYGS
ncbi:hypothetical protein LguiA_013236 [Lonicera macranthoides]